MDYTLVRNRNKAALAVLLAGQLVMLGYQVRRPDAGGVRLLQLWGVQAILPVEKLSERMVGGGRNLIHGYLALRQVNRQNQELESEVTRLRLDNMRLQEDQRELPGMAALLGLQRSYGLKTEAAQVISSGASEDAQAIYIDQGSNSGLTRNMAVITPDGVVGKLSQVLFTSAQVLLITDPASGVGALIGANGVHGIVRGTGAGRAELRMVFNDEPVPVGAAVITSGEDQVYPKGIPIGTVTAAAPGPIYQDIKIKLAADLGRLEQVLVVTGALPRSAEMPVAGLTAAEIRQALLPSVPAPAAGVPAAATLAHSPATPPTDAAVPFPTSAHTPPLEGDALGAPPAAPPPPLVAPAKTTAGPPHGGGPRL